MTALVDQPAWALLPALACAALWGWRRSPVAGYAALAWALYAGYEALMRARVLCSGECNIRVDLLLIHPALLLASVAALVATVRAQRSASA